MKRSKTGHDRLAPWEDKWPALLEMHDGAPAIRREPDWDAALAEAGSRDAEALGRIREMVAGTPIRLVRGKWGLVDVEAPREWRVRHGAEYAAVCAWIWDLGAEVVRRCLVNHLPEEM